VQINGGVNGLSTYKIKRIFLFSFDFSADPSGYSSMLLSNLLSDKLANNIRCMLKHFQTMYRSDSDYLNKTFLLVRKERERSLMKPLMLHIQGVSQLLKQSGSF